VCRTLCTIFQKWRFAQVKIKSTCVFAPVCSCKIGNWIDSFCSLYSIKSLCINLKNVRFKAHYRYVEKSDDSIIGLKEIKRLALIKRCRMFFNVHPGMGYFVWCNQRTVRWSKAIIEWNFHTIKVLFEIVDRVSILDFHGEQFANVTIVIKIKYNAWLFRAPAGAYRFYQPFPDRTCLINLTWLVSWS
jgi:hypothetical protein